MHFVKVATARRHNGLNTIYIKHNLFHRRELGRDIELQNSPVQIPERCFTNQYIRSTTMSEMTNERVESRCNIYSLWSFTH